MSLFRVLRADEIECRVSRCNQYGVNILLYKTARTDMDLLDEAVGPMCWQDDYREIKGNLYCGIGIKMAAVGLKEKVMESICGDGYDADARADDIINTVRNSDSSAEWIWKWNCGIESRQDGEGNEKKGEASDAFKRAGTCWGIGRELYTAPEIFIPAAKCNIKKSEFKGKESYKTYDTFGVERISYDENRRINHLEIKNLKTKQTVFVWPQTECSDQEVQTDRQASPQGIKAFYALSSQKGYDQQTMITWVVKNFGTPPEKLLQSQLDQILVTVKRWPDAT